MTISYYRPPTNPDGSRKSYAQRRNERKEQDAERRTQQKQESPTRDPIYDLPYHERQKLRKREEQGRREAEQRRYMEERAKQQAEYDALPDHEKRPKNIWRELLEVRRDDAWRRELRPRIKMYEREARREDERIDRLMAEKKRQHELQTQPEYARALDHWARASIDAETEDERAEWARLRGLIEGGGGNAYWDQVAPIMQARLAKIQERWGGQVEKQAAIVSESKTLAEQVAIAEELQVTPEQNETETSNEETE